MSVKDVVDKIRRVAETYGFGPLPLAKARNAVSLTVYGAPYSAVVAAERAGTLPDALGIDSAGVERVVRDYRVDARPLVAAALEALGPDKDPDEERVREAEASFAEQRGGSAGTPVYRPQIGTQLDAAALSGVGRFVPEATSFEIVFGGLSTEAEAYRTHIAERVVLEFPGKRRLEIEGAYLWKFLELEIPGLGTPLGGWFESSPYGPGTAEGLAKRIRAAYWSLFVDHVDKYVPPPVSVRIDFMSGDVTIVARREIAADTIDAMCQAVLDAMPPDRVDELARSLAVMRLDSPRSKLEFRPDPEFPGALRNTLVTSEWPSQVRAMSVGEFFRELAPDDDAERCGPIPSLMDRLTDGLRRAGNEALGEWFDHWRAKRGHAARALADVLGLRGRIGARDVRRRRFLEAVALSPAHSVAERTLVDSFCDRWWERRLGELLDGA